MLLDESMSECPSGYWNMSDTVLLSEASGKAFVIAVMRVYRPTHNSTLKSVQLLDHGKTSMRRFVDYQDRKTTWVGNIECR